MRRRLVIFLLLLFAVASVSAQKATITVRVLDQFSEPVKNAHVTASFDTAISPGWGWGSGRPNEVMGRTDTNGFCILSGYGNGGSVSVSVSKEGYYGSSGYQIVFTNVAGAVDKRWQPWNPVVELTLKRIGKPIPMYAKKVYQKPIPVADQPVGFDAKEGDWVVPYGGGKIADFIFKYTIQSEGSVTTRYGTVKTYNYALGVSFPGEGDGLMLVHAPLRGRSALRLPCNAPETGYQASIVKHIWRGQDMLSGSDVEDDANYFFRIRTVRDVGGNVANALYGKIHGDFQFDERRRITFTYYLNPTPNDRNMEFDPQQNLFTNLPPTEQVYDP